MSIIGTAMDFFKKIYESDNVKIKFIKKDGTERVMNATLNFNRIPKEARPKSVDMPKIINLVKKGIIRVFDLEKQEWRSVPFKNVEFLESGGNVYRIKK